MKKQNKHIKSFFESQEQKFLTINDILDIFVELTDLGFNPKTYDVAREKYGIYFIEFRKIMSEKSFGFINKGSAYGLTDLNAIKKELNIFEILEDAKHRIESMGYTIGFDMEFNFNSIVDLSITAHIQHSSLDQDSED